MLPEFYFIILCVWWFVYGNIINPETIYYPAIIVTLVLTVQLLIKKRAVGLVISTFFGLFSFYLILALVSDLVKGEIFNMNALIFLLQGGLLIVTNIVMSVWMFRKYL